jgi:CDP-diacylglycerol---glycerol-3-phosphate 3-phosphatidyltransferase
MTTATRLTLSRLLISPIVFSLFWIEKCQNHPMTSLIVNGGLVCLAAIGEITDALDGRFARNMNEVTDFGKLFDPFADYVYRFTFFFCFWWVELCPAWMIVLLFYREAGVSFLRLVLRGENVVLAARSSGKVKAVVQAIAIFIILLAQMVRYWKPGFPVYKISSSVMLVVVIVTLVSLIDYIHGQRGILRQIRK